MSQERLHTIAIQCKILLQAFAKTGITALIDEATIHQYIRDKIAPQEILEKYITKELLEWQKRFLDKFYDELFRLNLLPKILIKVTNDIVYARLAPGILNE